MPLHLEWIWDPIFFKEKDGFCVNNEKIMIFNLKFLIGNYISIFGGAIFDFGGEILMIYSINH